MDMSHAVEVEYQVWRAPVRAFHWINLAALLCLIASGLCILYENELSLPTASRVSFKIVHTWAGYVFAINLVVRIAWGFVDKGHGRLSRVLAFRRGFAGELRRYVAGGFGQDYVGLNPLGSLMVTALIGLLLAQAGTGIILAGTDLYHGPLGDYFARWVAAPGVDIATLVPGDRTSAKISKDGMASMRAFRAPIVTTHLYVFYAILVCAAGHVSGVVRSRLGRRVAGVSQARQCHLGHDHRTQAPARDPGGSRIGRFRPIRDARCWPLEPPLALPGCPAYQRGASAGRSIMKLMSFRRPDGVGSWGIVKGEGVIDLGSLAPSLKHALWAMTSLAEEATRHADFALADVTYLPPIPDADKILCVGLNYMTHIKEGGREPPTKPIIFTRFNNSLVGHGQAIIRPNASVTHDYEGEMAVIIGRRCRHVRKEDWQSVVAGYSCVNEGSIREFQRHTAQFTPGKNFFRSGGFGPWIVTPEEAGDITQQTLMTRVNGVEQQHAPIDDLCFDIPTLIEYCSTFTQLEAGDVIVTGTTGGVGAYQTPPLWMKPGDVVEVEVTGVGVLRNPVVAEG